MLQRADRGAERLERALEGGPIPHDSDTRRALAAAGGLTPGHGRNPARVQQTHDVMMAAFMRTLNPSEARDDAGTDDGLEEMELHRTEITLPDGGQLVVSDLEQITPERLEEAAQMAAEILARRAKDHHS
ncbi:hypothetical protein SAMN05216483_6720 [Streptomyces sp. 2131.1]|uniref:hypothetical protein n=1 Tax=Streptomyces sp. 2131.1 TaxID=1855346 RepID=UPI0008967906|nr:hypothetical protein [Streptomyces sp. 2131.1]SEE83689.1 hypothetical protein SAMN05216483_6720 [Streptomyces sp. 2131.1]